MNLAYEDMEKLFILNQQSRGVLRLLSSQEKDRLLDIVYSVLLEATDNSPVSPVENYNQWETVAKGKIIEALSHTKDFFDLSDLEKKLSLDEFLKNFFTFEFGEF